MKVAVLAASLLVVYAREPDAKEGETKCVCTVGWNSKCEGQGTDTNTGWEICDWLSECHVASNNTFSFCIPKGHKVCYRYQYLGTSGNIVAAAHHEPYKSCCDEKACTSRQTCVDAIGGDGTFKYEYKDSNGWTTTMYQHTVSSVAKNNWKYKDGSKIKNKPKVCIDKVFDAHQAGKQVLAPGISMIVVVFSIILAFRKKQGGCVDMIAPIVVMVLSFFLSLSEGWAFALFTMLVAAVTMCTPSEQKGKLVIFQVAFVWLYFGGANFFFAPAVQLKDYGTSPTNYFLLASTKKLTDLETKCATFYHDYYKTIKETTPWDWDSTKTTEGLCGREWISFLIIMAYAQAFALFLMVALTVLSYLSPLAAFSMKRSVKPAENKEAS